MWLSGCSHILGSEVFGGAEPQTVPCVLYEVWSRRAWAGLLSAVGLCKARSMGRLCTAWGSVAGMYRGSQVGWHVCRPVMPCVLHTATAQKLSTASATDHQVVCK